VHARLIENEPTRFFLPAYIGPRGYLGVRLDKGRVDWQDVAERVNASYRAVAPKRRAP
jgi:phosphoribosylglycinamide formyltransferase-1